MKVLIVSGSHTYNYGANLQEYALQSYICKKYPYVKCRTLWYKKDMINAFIYWIINKIKAKFFGMDDYPSLTFRECIGSVKESLAEGKDIDQHLFDEFWSKIEYESNHGKPYNRCELQKLNSVYDKFVSGSDQIWNCGRLYLDSTYMLDFVYDSSMKYSFAPSLGMHKIPEKYYSIYQECLSSFKELSCREQEGADIISKLTGREVGHVLDPVFLLDREEWIELTKSSAPIQKDGEYILIYTLSKSEEFIEKVKKYAAKRKEPVLIISDSNCNGQSTGPIEWLYLFANADEVFTDSYHGTAFSVIFNKQFSVFIPNDSFFQDSKSRITGLLDELEICNRIIDETYCFDELEDIDYDKVNDILSRLKAKSRDYLDRCLRE